MIRPMNIEIEHADLKVVINLIVDEIQKLEEFRKTSFDVELIDSYTLEINELDDLGEKLNKQYEDYFK